MGKRARTVEDIAIQARECNERAAVARMLSSYIRTRYLVRDTATSAQAQVPCKGAPVSEAILDEFARELDDSAGELDKQAASLLKNEVSDG